MKKRGDGEISIEVGCFTHVFSTLHIFPVSVLSPTRSIFVLVSVSVFTSVSVSFSLFFFLLHLFFVFRRNALQCISPYAIVV